MICASIWIWLALGTIADLVPLTGENRILASAGLERLTLTPAARPGGAESGGAMSFRLIGSYEAAFQFAPRLNAAGRLEDAEEALRLCWRAIPPKPSRSPAAWTRATASASKSSATSPEQVIAAVQARFDAEKDFVIVEGRDTWHIGVVGIVAARVVKRFYRPAIILGGDGAVWRGSGRSIEGFDLAAALRGCDALLWRTAATAWRRASPPNRPRWTAFRARLNEPGAGRR